MILFVHIPRERDSETERDSEEQGDREEITFSSI